MYFLTLKISFRKVYGKNSGLNELSEFSHPPSLPLHVSLFEFLQNSVIL